MVKSMSEQLQLREALPAEREAIFRKAHEFWGRGIDVEEYVAVRLNSPSYAAACWYVGCLGSQIVTSLAAYPMALTVHGITSPAMAIGSVHTRPEHRGCGYAAELIRYAERVQYGQGVRYGVLYSDISPDYYARLGYVACPSHQGTLDATSAEAGESGTGWRLEPLPAAEQVEELAEWYRRDHGSRSCQVSRSGDFWRWLLARRPDDEFFRIVRPGGGGAGYVRLEAYDGKWHLSDLAFPDATGSDWQGLAAVLRQMAHQRGHSTVSGWLPDNEMTRRCFAIERRRSGITMITSLDANRPLDDDAIAAVDYFCEIVHV